jgi:hypothetical protein
MTDTTLFLIGFIAILFLGLGVSCILMFSQVREKRKSNKARQQYIQYIDSIKSGDVFDWDNRDVRAYRDPFDESDDSLPLRTTIVDIKTNEAGVKWVKYYYIHSSPDGMQFTDTLEDFLKHRYRIQEAE